MEQTQIGGDTDAQDGEGSETVSVADDDIERGRRSAAGGAGLVMVIGTLLTSGILEFEEIGGAAAAAAGAHANVVDEEELEMEILEESEKIASDELLNGRGES